MKNEKWCPWETGFWFYKYRGLWGSPVVYMDRKRGYKGGTLNNCTKFRDEKSAREHYMKDVPELSLQYECAMEDWMKPLTKREFIEYLEKLNVPDDTLVFVKSDSEYRDAYYYNTFNIRLLEDLID